MLPARRVNGEVVLEDLKVPVQWKGLPRRQLQGSTSRRLLEEKFEIVVC